METRMPLGIVLCVLSGFCYSNPYYGSDDEYRLVRDLMKSYNKQVRPSLFNNLALNVSYGVALAQIIDLVVVTDDSKGDHFIQENLRRKTTR